MSEEKFVPANMQRRCPNQCFGGKISPYASGRYAHQVRDCAVCGGPEHAKSKRVKAGHVLATERTIFDPPNEPINRRVLYKRHSGTTVASEEAST